jgi:hypothetical protein
MSRLLDFFKYEHLPEEFQRVRRPFHALAWLMQEMLPPNEEKEVMLRKLLEAKDCAERVIISK